MQQLLLDARDRGTAILLVSQDIAELTRLGDRILVLRDARIVADLRPEEVDAYRIGALMTGARS